VRLLNPFRRGKRRSVGWLQSVTHEQASVLARYQRSGRVGRSHARRWFRQRIFGVVDRLVAGAVCYLMTTMVKRRLDTTIRWMCSNPRSGGTLALCSPECSRLSR